MRGGTVRLPRYADLPIRAKLLVPFVVLMIVWGGFGTLVLARASSREAQGYASSQLALAMDVARAAFAEEEASLLETVRTIARTVDVPEKLARRDLTALQEDVRNLTLNSEHDLVRVLDAKAAILISVEVLPGGPRVTRGGTMREQAAIDAARGKSDGLGDKWMGITGSSFFAAGPVRDASEKAIGAIVAADSGARIADRLARGTDARVTLYRPDGKPFASKGDPLPFRAAGSGLRASVDGGDEPYEALYAPLAARGTVIGTITVGLPSRLALADVRGTATVLALLVGFAVLCAVAVGIVTARAVTRPVGTLVHATRSLERGDLATRAAPHGRD
ncbi:MAG: HAMP domain-containing protein, partial [Actinomycetota bacterium]